MEFAHLAPDLFLDEKVFPFVVEDYMYLFSTGPTDVRSKHDVVKGIPLHGGLVLSAGEHLQKKEKNKCWRLDIS